MKDEPLDRPGSVRQRTAVRSGNAGEWFRAAVVGLCLLLASSAIGMAEDAADERLTFTMGEAWSVDLFPGGHGYAPYIADPVRPGFSMTQVNIKDSDIPDAGKTRYNFMLGGQYGVLKLGHARHPGMSLQMDIYGSFLGQFDLDNGTDNIGWDGFYGLILAWANADGLALKLAMQHDSSHVGDEYAERTGRRRINYTREEYVLGVSYRFPHLARVYAEGGYGHDLRNSDLQAPWRVKGGLEFEETDRFFNGRMGYYAAVDLTSMEETDWDTDVTVQAGFVMPVRRGFQTVRFGPVYRKGRSLIGEFFQRQEEWWGFVLWIEI